MAGRSPVIDRRRLPSICPTAASTARPRPSDRTTDVVSPPRAAIAPRARRNAGRPRAAVLARRAIQRAAVAARVSNTSAPAIPPAVHRVSRSVPENRMAAPTSAATSTAVIPSQGHPGRRLPATKASRNSVAARICSVRARGQSVKIRADSKPYSAASTSGMG